MDEAPIVVGVSPTTGSLAAVEWALDQSRRQKRPLVAVTAWQLPRGANPPALSQDTAAGTLAADATAKLAKTVAALAGETSSVEQRVVRGTPAAVLLAAAQDAELLVIGPPHPGELIKVRASLLAPQLIYRSPCPVVVLPAQSYDDPSWARRMAGRMVQAAGTAGRPGSGVRRPPPS